MSYNNIMPWWMVMMPRTTDPDYEAYIRDETNGIPDHVRKRLICLFEEKSKEEEK